MHWEKTPVQSQLGRLRGRRAEVTAYADGLVLCKVILALCGHLDYGAGVCVTCHSLSSSSFRLQAQPLFMQLIGISKKGRSTFRASCEPKPRSPRKKGPGPRGLGNVLERMCFHIWNLCFPITDIHLYKDPKLENRIKPFVKLLLNWKPDWRCGKATDEFFFTS